MNKDVRALKDASENLNTQKSTSRRILTSILFKNSQLKAKCDSFQGAELSIDNQFDKLAQNHRL